ncbi:MAG: hypothetical protein KAR45_14240 [Desulfobacteraceae bacterium]|nr:hypothetical protein [Desulfobacteraceae bacterium]
MKILNKALDINSVADFILSLQRENRHVYGKTDSWDQTLFLHTIADVKKAAILFSCIKAVALIAADDLYYLTPASNLFCNSIWDGLNYKELFN